MHQVVNGMRIGGHSQVTEGVLKLSKTYDGRRFGVSKSLVWQGLNSFWARRYNLYSMWTDMLSSLQITHVIVAMLIMQLLTWNGLNHPCGIVAHIDRAIVFSLLMFGCDSAIRSHPITNAWCYPMTEICVKFFLCVATCDSMTLHVQVIQGFQDELQKNLAKRVKSQSEAPAS